MNDISLTNTLTNKQNRAIRKFEHPDLTAKGEPRASVYLDKLETLWINTGTLCNIECVNCYIASSPKNDRLVYFSAEDACDIFDEISHLKLGTKKIGFTGGEPFLNPDMLLMLEDALSRGFKVLVLSNAMTPMQRPKVQQGLLDLRDRYNSQLTLRISLDHYGQELHEQERGLKTWDNAIAGMNWLAEHGFNIAIGGRTCWGETEAQSRDGYARLIHQHKWNIDPSDKSALVLLPEMQEQEDVPEITTECWSILNINPSDMMCATSRMVVKRKGEQKPTVLPCTLIPYDTRFDMGETLEQSLKADDGMFAEGAVKLCHTHCSKFCVLGGGSCSG